MDKEKGRRHFQARNHRVNLLVFAEQWLVKKLGNQAHGQRGGGESTDRLRAEC